MDPVTRSVRKSRQYRIGEACAALGGRPSTVEALTGLQHKDVVRIFFDDHESIPCGNKPFSADWLHKCNLIDRIQASLLLATFRRVTECGIPRDEALLTAFRLCVARFGSPSSPGDQDSDSSPRFRINLDRAFALVCHLEGIWAAKSACLALSTCDQCGSDYVHFVRARSPAIADCPFCNVIRRFPLDPRYRAAFEVRAVSVESLRRIGVLGPWLTARS